MSERYEAQPASRLTGMQQVSASEFFAIMGPRDVHPTPMPYRSEWHEIQTRRLIGVSTPGYRRADHEPKCYFVVPDLLPTFAK